MFIPSSVFCEASEETCQWLTEGKKSGTVHSVFSKAVNCEIGSDFFSFLSPHALAEPMALKMCYPPSFTGSGLCAGDPVKIEFPVFFLGAHTFSAIIARKWRESMTLSGPIPPGLALEAFNILGEFLSRRDCSSGAGAMLGAHSNVQSRYWAGCVSNLILAKTAREHLNSMDALIGLGPGLTPSGDDFLCGYMRTMLLEKDFPFGELIRGLKHKTNSLSARSLELAASGRCAEDENLLFASLFFQPSPTETEIRLNRIASYGATSGTDLLYGIWIALGEMLYGDGLVKLLFHPHKDRQE